MPVTSKKSIERMVSLCGASIPNRLAKLMARYCGDPASLKAAGLEYAIMQTTLTNTKPEIALTSRPRREENIILLYKGLSSITCLVLPR
jgi:5,10-methylenetetrahydrofolate reductase